jgi:SSS family solute:Na+ symporter
MSRVQAESPQLLERPTHGPFAPGAWASWALAISLTVIAFPHMLVRVMAARDQAALRNTCRLYPPALLLLWLPVVMIGVWGAAEMPGLDGRASDRILPLMIAEHMAPVWHGLGLAAILAAVMSTLDAQFLTLSSMLGRDVLRRFRPHMSDKTELWWARVFSVALALGTIAVVLARPGSIFGLATYAFSGYVMLVPTLYLGLRWRRFSGAAGIASIVAGNLVLLVAFAREAEPGGVQPVAWGLLAAIAAAIVGAWRWPRTT